MRLLFILPAFALMIYINGCQTEPSETDKQILKNLTEINQKLTVINEQTKKNKEELEEPDTPLPDNRSYHTEKGPDIRRLKKIKLAKNASRKDVEEYIQKIVNASKDQNRFSSEDMQISMLREVGPENVDLLIPYAQDYYVQCVLPSLVTEKDKKQILEVLKIYPQLITCVVKNNWAKDAREIIFEKLKYSRGGYLRNEWINAAVQLASPKEYDMLKEYFIHCNNPEMTYNALLVLENFDMKDAVDKAWDSQKHGYQPWTTKQMAMIAAKFGHKDALKYLINAYLTEREQYSIGRIRISLYQLTGKTLSPKKMQEWYKENEADLVFDLEKERYTIKADKK